MSLSSALTNVPAVFSESEVQTGGQPPRTHSQRPGRYKGGRKAIS